MSLTTTIKLFSFLIDPTFWSRIGFLISYIATSFLVLEVLRLIYTDVNKREVEKFLESYSKQRTGSPPRRIADGSGKRMSRETSKERINISIEALERPVTPPTKRQTRRESPETEKTVINDAQPRLRRTRTSSSTSPPPTQQQQPSTTPVKKLRKRSDTLNSSSSGEQRRPLRRHREASPASEAGSKASSRHESPRPRSKEERKMSAGLGLGNGLGMGRVRGKV